MSASESKFLTEKRLAIRWCVSERSLQKWRLEGCGPEYVKIGAAVRYSVAVIEKYEDDRRRRNTGQA